MAPREVVETPIYALTVRRHTAWLPWNIYIKSHSSCGMDLITETKEGRL